MAQILKRKDWLVVTHQNPVAKPRQPSPTRLLLESLREEMDDHHTAITGEHFEDTEEKKKLDRREGTQVTTVSASPITPQKRAYFQGRKPLMMSIVNRVVQASSRLSNKSSADSSGGQMSTLAPNSGSIIGRHSRSSTTSAGSSQSSEHVQLRHRKIKRTLPNTYQLGPFENQAFNPAFISEICQAILFSTMEKMIYDHQRCKRMTTALSNEIKYHVKMAGVSRHKLIVLVSIGQNANQGIISASRCLWDTFNDNYVSVVFRNKSIFAWVNVYAVYLD